MLRKFNPDGFAASPNYSHLAEATSIGRMVFVAGQIGTRPASRCNTRMPVRLDLPTCAAPTRLKQLALFACFVRRW